jgi:hypothetical protein
VSDEAHEGQYVGDNTEYVGAKRYEKRSGFTSKNFTLHCSTSAQEKPDKEGESSGRCTAGVNKADTMGEPRRALQ